MGNPVDVRVLAFTLWPSILAVDFWGLTLRHFLGFFVGGTALLLAVPAAAQDDPPFAIPPKPEPSLWRAEPPPPPPTIVYSKERPLFVRGDAQLWITENDYPVAALRAEQEGVTTFRLDVNEKGRVVGCVVKVSSGSEILDVQTCRLLKRRSRFTPHLDFHGRPAPASWHSRYHWVLPRD